MSLRDMQGYDYRGFAIVVFPSGKTMIHYPADAVFRPGATNAAPAGQRRLLNETCASLQEAQEWIDAYMA